MAVTVVIWAKRPFHSDQLQAATGRLERVEHDADLHLPERSVAGRPTTSVSWRMSAGPEKNDAKAWLPANAESTKVLDLQARIQPPNVFPAVVVYERTSGLTAADRAKAAADARRFAAIHGVGPGRVTGPIPAADGKA